MINPLNRKRVKRNRKSRYCVGRKPLKKQTLQEGALLMAKMFAVTS